MLWPDGARGRLGPSGVWPLGPGGLVGRQREGPSCPDAKGGFPFKPECLTMCKLRSLCVHLCDLRVWWNLQVFPPEKMCTHRQTQACTQICKHTGTLLPISGGLGSPQGPLLVLPGFCGLWLKPFLSSALDLYSGTSPPHRSPLVSAELTPWLQFLLEHHNLRKAFPDHLITSVLQSSPLHPSYMFCNLPCLIFLQVCLTI